MYFTQNLVGFDALFFKLKCRLQELRLRIGELADVVNPEAIDIGVAVITCEVCLFPVFEHRVH